MNNDEHEIELDENKPKSGNGFLYTTLAIFFVFAIKLVGGFIFTEARVEMSKYKSWDREFRDAYKLGCTTELKKDFWSTKEYRVLAGNKDMINFVNKYSEEYCSCATGAIEDANVLATKYNKLKMSVKELGKYYESETEKWMSTAEGKKATNNCLKQAEEFATLKPTGKTRFKATMREACYDKLIPKLKATYSSDNLESLEYYANTYCDCYSENLVSVKDFKYAESWSADEVINKNANAIERYIASAENIKKREGCAHNARSMTAKIYGE